jgi:hypothetical protein
MYAKRIIGRIALNTRNLSILIYPKNELTISQQVNSFLHCTHSHLFNGSFRRTNC